MKVISLSVCVAAWLNLCTVIAQCTQPKPVITITHAKYTPASPRQPTVPIQPGDPSPELLP